MQAFGFICVIAVAYALPVLPKPPAKPPKSVEQNLEAQNKERALILKEVAEAKPEVQIYNEQDPIPEDEKNHDFILKEAEQSKPQYQKYDEQNSDSSEFRPLNDGELSSEEIDNKKKSKPKLVIPKPPSFSTKLSVPSLPISLSSLPTLGIKWPIRVPAIFKRPKITYLG
ncbi:unnamed protein product [Colias eurytheme]|nr:unnamed protein product [Colias eurytheme]